MMEFRGGERCFNGPARTARVVLQCADAEALAYCPFGLANAMAVIAQHLWASRTAEDVAREPAGERVGTAAAALACAAAALL